MPNSATALVFCPYCGGVNLWRFGIVYHATHIHVRLRNQPSDCKTVQELATIIERAPVKQARKLKQ